MKFCGVFLIALLSLPSLAEVNGVTAEQIWADQRKKHGIKEEAPAMNGVTAEQIWADQRKKHGIDPEESSFSECTKKSSEEIVCPEGTYIYSTNKMVRSINDSLVQKERVSNPKTKALKNSSKANAQ